MVSKIEAMTPVDSESLERAQDAIAVRNEIVHEGRILPRELEDEDVACLRAAIEVGSMLCPGGKARFVVLFGNNMVLKSADDWEHSPWSRT